MSQSQYLKLQSEGGVVEARILCEKFAEREASVVTGELLAAGPGCRWRVILDMSDVMLLASVGLGAIVNIDKQLRAQGGRLALFNLQPEILAVMKLTKLDRLLTLAGSRDEAIAKLPT